MQPPLRSRVQSAVTRSVSAPSHKSSLLLRTVSNVFSSRYFDEQLESCGCEKFICEEAACVSPHLFLHGSPPSAGAHQSDTENTQQLTARCNSAPRLLIYIYYLYVHINAGEFKSQLNVNIHLWAYSTNRLWGEQMELSRAGLWQDVPWHSHELLLYLQHIQVERKYHLIKWIKYFKVKAILYKMCEFKDKENGFIF